MAASLSKKARSLQLINAVIYVTNILLYKIMTHFVYFQAHFSDREKKRKINEFVLQVCLSVFTYFTLLLLLFFQFETQTRFPRGIRTLWSWWQRFYHQWWDRSCHEETGAESDPSGSWWHGQRCWCWWWVVWSSTWGFVLQIKYTSKSHT